MEKGEKGNQTKPKQLKNKSKQWALLLDVHIRSNKAAAYITLVLGITYVYGTIQYNTLTGGI